MASKISEIEKKIQSYIEKEISKKLKIVLMQSIDNAELKQGFTVYIRFISQEAVNRRNKFEQNSSSRKTRYEVSYKLSLFYKDYKRDSTEIYDIIDLLIRLLNEYQDEDEFVSPLIVERVEYTEKSPNAILQFDILFKVYLVY